VIRAILNVARDEWGWLEKVPKIPLYGQEPTDYQWLTREEFAALLTHLPPHTRQLARFAVATGLRRTNITHLRWSQVDLKRGHVHVNPTEAKGKKGLQVPLNDDALAILSEQQSAEKPSKVWVFPYHGEPVYQVSTKAWREAVKKIKRKGFRFHDLRHTWASWHVQAGTPLHALQALGGWSSPVLVARYGHHDSSSLRDYAQAVRASSGTSLARDTEDDGKEAVSA
jgi:integrase